jgi:hypothetical protein
VERKNGWQLAEAAGDARPDGMQDFLAQGKRTRSATQGGAQARDRYPP